MVEELTEDEILSLSFEMKICYLLYPWNHNFTGQNYTDWINDFSILDRELSEKFEHVSRMVRLMKLVE